MASKVNTNESSCRQVLKQRQGIKGPLQRNLIEVVFVSAKSSNGKVLSMFCKGEEWKHLFRVKCWSNRHLIWFGENDTSMEFAGAILPKFFGGGGGPHGARKRANPYILKTTFEITFMNRRNQYHPSIRREGDYSFFNYFALGNFLFFCCFKLRLDWTNPLISLAFFYQNPFVIRAYSFTSHDAMHGLSSSNKKVNQALGCFPHYLFSYNFYWKLSKHHEHHSFVPHG